MTTDSKHVRPRRHQGYVHVAKRLLRHTRGTPETGDTDPTPRSTTATAPSRISATTQLGPSDAKAASIKAGPPAPSPSTASATLGLVSTPTPSPSNRRVSLCDLGNYSGQFPLIEAVIGRHGQVGSELDCGTMFVSPFALHWCTLITSKAMAEIISMTTVAPTSARAIVIIFMRACVGRWCAFWLPASRTFRTYADALVLK